MQQYMKIRQIDYVIFDLDGTLINTLENIQASLNYALSEHKLTTLTTQEIKVCIGHGGDYLIRTALQKSDCNVTVAAIDKILESYDKFQKKLLHSNIALYPDVIETLSILKKQGLRLAICTNKRKKLASQLIQHFKLTEWIDDVVYGDTLTYCKPDPMQLSYLLQKANAMAEKAIMIGDTGVDAEAAQRANMLFIGVTYGYDQSVKHMPCPLLNQFKDLPKLLNREFL